MNKGNVLKNFSFNGQSFDYAQGLIVAVGGHVTLPADADFLRAEYAQSGPDLLIYTPDGASFFVADYFSVETQPDLVTAEGGVLSASIVMKLAGTQAPGLFVQATLGPGLGEPIGSITELEGAVNVTHVDGRQSPLLAGGSIYQGDVLETGTKASIGVVFADDTTFSLGEEGRMTLDEMVYDPDNQSGAFGATVLAGTFSFVSGKIAKTSPDAMVLSTPVATIGIRGSTGLGQASGEGSENTITLVPDVDGNLGELSVSTQAGTQVLNQANASTTVTSAFAPPSPLVFLSAQEIQQQFGSTFSVLTRVVAKQAQHKAEEAGRQADEAKGEAEAAKAEADQADQEAAQAEQDAEAAQAQAEAAQAEAEAAEAEVEAAKASGDPEALAAAEEKAAQAAAKVEAAQAQVETAKVAAAEAAQTATQAEAQAAEAGAAAAQAQVEAQQTQQFSSLASTASKAQAETFATLAPPAEEAAAVTSAEDTAATPTETTTTTPADATSTTTVVVAVEETVAPVEVILPEIVLSEPLVLTTVVSTAVETTTTTTTTITTTTAAATSPIVTYATNTILVSATFSYAGGIVSATVTDTSGLNETKSAITSFTGTAFADTYDLRGVTLGTLNVGTGADVVTVDATTHITSLSNRPGAENTYKTLGTDGTGGDMDLSGTTVSGEFAITLNSTGVTGFGTQTLTVNSATSFDTATYFIQIIGDATAKVDVSSDDGMNVSGISFSNLNSIIVDSGSDTVGAVLTLGSGGWQAGVTITGSGDDIIQGSTTTLNIGGTTVTGISAVKGTTANDTITGSNSADTIYGGAGNDTISGGTGADIFVYEATAAANGNDTITDFVAGTDKINLNAFETAGTMIGMAANTVTNTTGTVFYLFGWQAGAADTTASTISAINAAANITDSAVTSMLVISDNNSTAIYEWTGNGAGDKATGDTLTLMGTLNVAMAAATDISIV